MPRGGLCEVCAALTAGFCESRIMRPGPGAPGGCNGPQQPGVAVPTTRARTRRPYLLFRRAVAIAEKVLGPKHHICRHQPAPTCRNWTAPRASTLRACHASSGALAVEEKGLGTEPITDVSNALLNYAALLRETNRYA